MPLPPTAFVLTTAISLVPSKKPKRRRKKRRKKAEPEGELRFKRTPSLTHVVPLAPRIIEAAGDVLEGFDVSTPQFRMPWPRQCQIYLRCCFALSGCDDGSFDVRQTLEEIYPQYDWSVASEEMDEDQTTLLSDAILICDVATKKMQPEGGREKIRVGKKRYLARPRLQDASLDLDALELGDVVECKAAAPQRGDDEFIYAEVTKLTGPNGEPEKFEVTVIGRWKGVDCAPERSEAHGFRFVESDEQQSSRMFLTRDDNSGVVRLLGKRQEDSDPVDVSHNTRENRG